MWLGDDGTIWMYHPDQYGRGVIDNIAQPIYKSLQVSNVLLRKASAVYNPRFDEYRINIPFAGGNETATVYRFNKVIGWTEDFYPFAIRSMSFAIYGQSLTIDDLIGTIDSLVGAIDDLTNNQPATKVMFTMALNSFGTRQIFIENKPTTIAVDVGSDGFSRLGTLRLETGYVRAAEPFHKTETLQLLLEYECNYACTLNFYYCDDGLNWNLLQAIPVGPSGNQPVQLTLDYTLDRANIQFALESLDVINLRLIDFIVMAREGGLISDAN
jgi:hypothetical protein